MLGILRKVNKCCLVSTTWDRSRRVGVSDGGVDCEGRRIGSEFVVVVVVVVGGGGGCGGRGRARLGDGWESCSSEESGISSGGGIRRPPAERKSLRSFDAKSSSRPTTNAVITNISNIRPVV